jgi:hypothetical protein
MKSSFLNSSFFFFPNKMREFFIFYILLVVLIILLIFTILLYSDYHSRTLAPSLFSANYPIEDFGGTWETMKIMNDTSTTAGTLIFGSAGSDVTNTNNVSFIPMGGDEKRKLSGNLIMLLGSTDVNGDTIKLRMIDNGVVICDESEFFIPSFNNWGLSPVRLKFKTTGLDTTTHNLVVEIMSSQNETINSLVMNSAYVAYY